MAPIAEVSAGHDHVLILTGNLFDNLTLTRSLTHLVNGEVYSFGTAQALLGHSAQPFDLPRRVPELVGKKIVQIAAGLYANAFLTGLFLFDPFLLNFKIFNQTRARFGDNTLRV